ncbi:MAG TPA: efflux RND transporter permease subunit [Steroidobacteraceae bacterium]|nr:efflux RND transporter permease subunit [Steroidobacteraceae bacterium]
MSIRRYVFAFMLNALLVLFGVIAYQRIGVDRYPEIDFPVVSVTTALLGANPDIIDASITNVIETAVNSVPGIDHIQSSSSPGVSVIAITFDLAKDIDVAFTEVQSKVNQVLRQLPDEADPPIVQKVEIGAQPVMWLALQGDRTPQQLSQYARNVIKKRLETIDGVGEVRIGGERRRTIRVNVDPQRMAALGVAASDLRRAFQQEHLQLPGGFLVAGDTEQLVKLDLEFHSPAELEQMIVRYESGAPIRLGDFAVVEDGLADFRQLARFQGRPTIGLGIVRVSNANTVAVLDEVRHRIETEIRPQLPPGMTLTYASDDSSLIREIVAALQAHLVEGTILAGLVVWFFLRSFRATLIIATAIPVSLLGAVALMYFLGYSFNTLTLLALLLLIGVVVDDAIVVLENIYRQQEHADLDPVTAAEQGSDQVVFAVTAASLTLISIFGSVVFLGGIIGRFFESFAVVVAFGVAVSLLVSLTLTPMLCSRYLVVKRRHGALYHTIERWLGGLEHFYRRLLGASLDHRWRVLAIGTIVVLSSAFFFADVGKAFLPEEDEGRFVVGFRAPLGIGIEASDRYLGQLEEVLLAYPEIETVFTAIGLGIGGSGQVNRAFAFVTMTPRDERQRSQQDVLTQLRADLAQIPGIFAYAASVPAVGGARGEPLQFSVVGPELERVAQYARELRTRLEGVEGLGRLDLDLQLDLPQVRVRVDRTRAADLGLASADVAFAVNLLAGGYDIAKYNDEPGDGERYDVRVKAMEGTLGSTGDLSRIFVRAADGSMVRLDTVAGFEEVLGPAVINRYNLQYAANFFATPSIPLGDAVLAVQAAALDVLPLGYEIELQGEAREFTSTARYAAFAFALAIVLVYMVLASQFNSLIQPLIVMVAQPLAVIGGLVALWLTNETLNIYSMIGMVLLIGLVAKNSILLVDLANQLRAQGRSVDDALREACPIRLRPVLMTSLTVILALLPAALGLGAGAATNGPLAIAVIGGRVSSTLLTLVVVPAMYSLIEGARATRAVRSANLSINQAPSQ